jgi:hypothetical protein
MTLHALSGIESSRCPKSLVVMERMSLSLQKARLECERSTEQFFSCDR